MTSRAPESEQPSKTATGNTPPPPLVYTPPMEPLSVLHEDAHILIINKPSGLLSVAGRTPDLSDCLESRAHALYPEARIVHRLDMDTSGIMILARDAQSHKRLGWQFEKRKVEKTYIARVWDHIKGDNGLIDLPMRCDWPNRPKQMIDHKLGRSAQTKWSVLARETDATAVTRVSLSPITGRSHQLRVHMMTLGHPILGDSFYAGEQAYTAASRLQLHAQNIAFFHPETNEFMHFESACPF